MPPNKARAVQESHIFTQKISGICQDAKAFDERILFPLTWALAKISNWEPSCALIGTTNDGRVLRAYLTNKTFLGCRLAIYFTVSHDDELVVLEDIRRSE